MTPVHRRLAANVLMVDLDAEMRTVRAELAAGHGRIARTLVKEGPLRLTLVGLAPGGALHEHRTEAPITIQLLEGEIVLEANGESRTVTAGSLAALESNVPHAVRAPNGAFLLLTVAAQSPAGDQSRTAAPG